MSSPFGTHAKVAIRQESSGWYSWQLIDQYGGKLTSRNFACSGRERRRAECSAAGNVARIAWNKENPPTAFCPEKKQRPIPAKAGEWTDGINT